jgi:transposase
MSESMALVGLDVHQAQTVAAVLDPVSGELRVQRLRGEPAVVVPGLLEALGRPVRAVYEAGPTGFGLARAATERGLDVRVIAPGSIPRAPGDRVKTDRRDAKRLVRLFAAGELSFAFVPSEPDERFRDLVRCIDDARKDLMRSRHRLSKFLLRRGLRFPGRAWTQPHGRWLGKLSFDDALSQAVLVDYVCAVDALVQRRRALIAVLEDAVPASSHAQTIARLRCFRGINTLTAAGLCAEVGRFERFAKPSLLSGFLGIVPCEYTSSEKRVQGAITKAGPTHARRLLVEAAHHYRRGPRVSYELAARHAGQDPRIVQIAWRAQRRLHSRWAHLGSERGKPTGTVAVACARELAAFCWEAATLN